MVFENDLMCVSNATAGDSFDNQNRPYSINIHPG